MRGRIGCMNPVTGLSSPETVFSLLGKKDITAQPREESPVRFRQIIELEGVMGQKRGKFKTRP